MKVGNLVKYSSAGLNILFQLHTDIDLDDMENHVGIVVSRHPTRDHRCDVMWISPKDISGMTDMFLDSEHLEIVSENDDQ